MVRIERFVRLIQQASQRMYSGIATRRALIDIRLMRSQCLCIRLTPGIAALAALRLRQYGIDAHY